MGRIWSSTLQELQFCRVLLVVKFSLFFILRIKINIYYEVPRSVRSVTLHTVFVALLHQSITVPTTEALLLETCIRSPPAKCFEKECRVFCGDLLLLLLFLLLWLLLVWGFLLY